MSICDPQNISVFRVEINLEVTSNETPKVDFVIAFNRILIRTCTPLQG